MQKDQHGKNEREVPEPAQVGNEYEGRIVSIHADTVIQRDSRTKRLVSHRLNAITGGTLTVDQEARIRYPVSMVGLVVPLREKELEADKTLGAEKDMPERGLDR